MGQSQLTPEQAHQIDSIKQVIKTAKHDSTLLNCWQDWDNIIYASDPDLDFELNYKIDSLSSIALEKNQDKKERKQYLKFKALALNNIGIIYKRQSKLNKAMRYFKESLKIKKEIGDKERIASSVGNVGVIYSLQGSYSTAIQYFTQSLKIHEELGNSSGIASSLSNIGAMYTRTGDGQKGLSFALQSLRVREKLGNQQKLAFGYTEVGTCYAELKNYEEAQHYLNKAQVIQKEIGDKYGVGRTLSSLGSLYGDIGNTDKAIDYFNQSTAVLEEIGYQLGVANNLSNVAAIYGIKGDHQKAIQYSSKSLQIGQDLGGIAEQKNAAGTLWKAYKDIHSYQKALETYELFITLRDSAESEENQKAVIRQEYKYAYEKQAAADSVKTAEGKKVSDAELKATKAENARQKLEAEREEQLKYGLYGVLALAVLFGLFIFNRFRVTRKQRDIIDIQKQEVETQKEKVDEAYDELEEKNTEILDSINYAKRIQSAILPPTKLVKEYLNQSFILYKPKDIVAGDFYWMEPLAMATDSDGTSENGVLFAAADCTGHGVPGAMVSVVCNNGLNRAVREYGLTDPGQILDKTREIVISEFEKSEEEVKDGMDIALVSLEGKTLKYAGAHNPLWIIRKRRVNESKGSADAGKKSSHSVRGEENDKPDLSAAVEITGKEQAFSDYELIEIKADKQPIGKYAEPKPYTTQTIELNDGDSFYIFSDGYADQFGGDGGRPGGKKYKTANFKRLLLSIQNESIEQQRQLIDEAFEAWKGQLEQLDDVCVIGVSV